MRRPHGAGLDARAAAVVMRAVRNTVNTGRTVVCTIHQPSIDIFESFDELLLLKRGGRTIFCGELGRESTKLIAYFSVRSVSRGCCTRLHGARACGARACSREIAPLRWRAAGHPRRAGVPRRTQPRDLDARDQQPGRGGAHG